MWWLFDKTKPDADAKLKEEIATQYSLAQAEFVSDVRGKVDSELDRCRKEYDRERTIFYGIVVMFGLIGGYFGFKTRTEMEKAIAENVEQVNRLTDELVNTTKSRIGSARSEVEKKIDQELNRQFESANIQTLVEKKAKERVDEQAGPLIRHHIDERIEPNLNEVSLRLTKADNTEKELKDTLATGQEKVVSLETNLQEATTLLNEVRDESYFFRQALLANNDHRSAFEYLIKLSDDKTDERRDNATAVLKALRGSHFEVVKPFELVNWAETGTNRLSFTLEQIAKAWTNVDSTAASGFVNFVLEEHPTLTEDQKLAFARSVCVDSRNSLNAAHMAATYISKKLHSRYSARPLDFKLVEEEFDQYFKTNRIGITNEGAIKELNFSSEANVTVRQVTPQLQLLSVKLKGVPKANTFHGRIFGLDPLFMVPLETMPEFQTNILEHFLKDFPPLRRFRVECIYDPVETKKAKPLETAFHILALST